MQKTYLLVIGMTVCLLFLIPACTVEQGPNSAELKAPEDIQMLSLGDTTYYIDSETGDDARAGTSLEMPWKSLRKVNSVTFAAGDKILFKAGSRYTGQLKPQGSGKAGSVIMIDKYGDSDEKPRIDGEGAVLDTLLLENVEYWEVSNLEITNLGPTRQEWRTGVKALAEDSGTLKHIHFKNLYVHDVNGSLDKNTEGCGIFIKSSGQKQSRFDGLLIENCHVVRTDRNGICMASLFFTTDSIDRKTGKRTGGNWFPSLNVVIRGNLIEDCGGDCIKPWGCDGALVEHNVIRGGRMRCKDYAAGIWPWSCDNTVIQFNEVSKVKGFKDGQAFDSDSNCYNTVIQYNYSHDNDGGFILIIGAPPGAELGDPGLYRTIVRYNISQNDGERIFHLAAGGTHDSYIYNNTIYIGPQFDIPMVLFTGWDGWPDNTNFYNNTFYVDGKASYAYGTSRNNEDGTYNYELGYGQSTNNFFSNNVYYGNHVNPPTNPNAVPYDAAAITIDPMMIAPGSGGEGLDSIAGYKLKDDSVCIGAGMPIIGNGGRDLWDNKLPGAGALDIGAHQFSGSD